MISYAVLEMDLKRGRCGFLSDSGETNVWKQVVTVGFPCSLETVRCGFLSSPGGTNARTQGVTVGFLSGPGETNVKTQCVMVPQRPWRDDCHDAWRDR